MDIFEKYGSELALVENELSNNLCSNQPDLMEICSYLSTLKGKRIRPLIVILSYRFAGGEKMGEIIPLASALEFIHTATLVHDDMNDRSAVRRRHETVYSKYGMSKALITGDYLFSLGFALGGSYGKKVVELVAELSSKLAEGEFMHLRANRDPELTEQVYLDIIERKTAGPIIGGAKIGGIIGSGDERVIEILGEYGRNVGMAFQIVDDIFDITGKVDSIGKPVGVDLRSGKITLLTIQALKELDEGRRGRLVEIIKSENITDEMNHEALEMIRSTNAVDYCRKLADSYVEAALEALSEHTANEIYSDLAAIARYTVSRTY